MFLNVVIIIIVRVLACVISVAEIVPVSVVPVVIVPVVVVVVLLPSVWGRQIQILYVLRFFIFSFFSYRVNISSCCVCCLFVSLLSSYLHQSEVELMA